MKAPGLPLGTYGVGLATDTLQTILIEIEAIVNSRPLIPITFDPKDDEPLTPNHLLLLRGVVPLPPVVYDKKDCYVRRRWVQIQYLSDQFWRRFVGNICQIYNRDKNGFKPNETSNKTILFCSLVTYCQEVYGASAELKRHFQTKRV